MPLLGTVGWERRLKSCCLAEWMMSGRRPYKKKPFLKQKEPRAQKNQICWHGRRWTYWSGIHCPQHPPPHVHISVLLEDAATASLAFGCFLPLHYILSSASALLLPWQKQITSSSVSKIQASVYGTGSLWQGKKALKNTGLPYSSCK